MWFPELKKLGGKTQTRRVFGGYNHTSNPADGAFYDMLNLSSDSFPALSVRAQRGEWRKVSYDEQGNVNGFEGIKIFIGGGITAAEDVDGRLCFCTSLGVYAGGGLIEGCTLKRNVENRRIVPFGRNIFIAPDGKYISFADDGSYEVFHAANEFNSSGELKFSCCLENAADMGEYFGISYDAPVQGDKKIADENGKSYLYEYSDGEWKSLGRLYAFYTAEGIDKGFAAGDSIEISGFENPLMNGSFTVAGTVENGIMLDCGLIETGASGRVITLKKSMPLLDFALEHGNRVWGCRYGPNEKGEFVNEIYASALGRPCEWRRFEGLSSDSYCASLGCSGEFTGAAVLSGELIFFKEDRIIRVSGSTPSDFYVSVIPARGVEKGASLSLCRIGESLYYKSRDGIMVYDGTQPYKISQELGGESYTDAVAGGINGKYYIAMSDKKGERSIFVYDSARGLWHREDNKYPVRFFVYRDNCLYSVNLFSETVTPIFTQRAYSFCIHDISCAGKACDIFSAQPGDDYFYAEEGPFEWFAESGAIAANEPDSFILRKLVIRLKTEKDSVFRIHVKCEGESEWRLLYESCVAREKAFSLPLTLPRCDALRLRFSGRGACEIYSVSRIFEKTGEVNEHG